jgi:uncharacterized protein YecA (UPF0149 family)
MPDEITESQDHAVGVLEHSRFERDITRDDATVRICIYRGQDDPGWILEIEDELGGSTCWDDLFDSDQAALDEALRTIDEEGIRSFIDVGSDPASMRALWSLTVAQSDIAELRNTLASSGRMSSFHGVCGVLAAVVSMPDFRAPSEWIELIKGDHIFASVADVQRFTNGVMALYNEVVRFVTELGAHCCPPAEDQNAVREFCEGYMRIAASEAATFRDPKALVSLLPICALAGTVKIEKLVELADALGESSEQFLQRSREELADNVVALHAYWNAAREAAAERLQQRALPQRRASPKVGRNELCPCGSGKKFKKCCA